MKPDSLRKKMTRIRSEKHMQGSSVGFVLINGCMDLIQAGHVSFLEAAKKSWLPRRDAYVTVGINSDESIKKLKGPLRPLIPEEQRLYMINSLKWVDFAFIFDSTDFSPYIQSYGKCLYLKGEDYSKLTSKEIKALEETGSEWKSVVGKYITHTSELIKRINEKI